MTITSALTIETSTVSRKITMLTTTNATQQESAARSSRDVGRLWMVSSSFAPFMMESSAPGISQDARQTHPHHYKG